MSDKILAILVLLCLYLIEGFAVSVAWNISLSQMFDLPRASLANGIGLSVLIAALRRPRPRAIAQS